MDNLDKNSEALCAPKASSTLAQWKYHFVEIVWTKRTQIFYQPNIYMPSQP